MKLKEGSYLDWRAAHLGGVDPRIGKIYCKEAIVLVNDGKISNASILVDMNNMTVDNLPEDGAVNLMDHLKTADFFNVEKYPTPEFALTNLEAMEGEYNSKVTGNLTILGVSKSITFNANINVSDSEVSVQSEDFSINRADWGLNYNAEGTEGVPLDYLISNDVGFTIHVAIAK